VSHAPEESVDPEDIESAMKVLATFLPELLREEFEG
jgi:acetylornithine deacetylase/succinyl-diaminopimelate desuccinylase-like protein